VDKTIGPRADSGTQTSAGSRSVPAKPRGVTAAMEKTWPPIRSGCPMEFPGFSGQSF
jgi:hypothetical protein